MSMQPLYLEHLARADAVRSGMAGVRREIARGYLSPTVALTDGRSGPLKVARLLGEVPGVGVAAIPGILMAAGIITRGGDPDPNRRVRELTGRQRAALASVLPPDTCTWRCWTSTGPVSRCGCGCGRAHHGKYHTPTKTEGVVAA